jgi:hypothetical protein
LQAKPDNEVVVGQPSSAFEDDRVLLGLERNNPLADPVGAGGDEVSLLPLGFFLREDAGTDQGPQRLVVVFVGGLDDPDPGAFSSSSS